MRSILRLLIGAIVVYAAAMAAQRFFVPNVVAIAATEEPQPLWALETAFVLRSIENIALFVAIILIALIAAQWVRRRMQGPSPSDDIE
jgi:lysylphosphatidylglycerol synthetase-like protein (DUF2156 family)